MIQRYLTLALNSQEDSKTGTCSVLVNETISLSNTANLPTALKTGVGAKDMLTNNLDIFDRSINGAMGKVLYMDIKRDTPLIGRIFMKFDDSNTVNSRKDGRLFQERWKFIPGKMEDYSRKDGRLFQERWKIIPGKMEGFEENQKIMFQLLLKKSFPYR